MLGYASPSPVAARRFSPTSIALILGGHAALLALVVSARTELIPRTIFDPIKVITIADPAPPPPPPPAETRHTTIPTRHETSLHAEPVHEIVVLNDLGDPGQIKLDTGPYQVAAR